jgi:hypothetical protein
MKRLGRFLFWVSQLWSPSARWFFRGEAFSKGLQDGVKGVNRERKD